MNARLSIRSYTLVSHTHAHDFHQLVLPLVGTVDIDTGRHEGRASPGQCTITVAGDVHRFTPEQGFRFYHDRWGATIVRLVTNFATTCVEVVAFVTAVKHLHG